MERTGRARARVALLVVGLCLATLGCAKVEGGGQGPDLSGRAVEVVATTSIVADVVREVGGDRVEVTALMGPGVDPHTYKAKESDVTAMADADVIFYNGLHLEGKMTELFEQMQQRGIRTYALASEAMTSEDLRASETYPGSYDPHVWFDVGLWQRVVREAEAALSNLDPSHADTYAENARAYLAELEALDAYVRARVDELPEERRVLVTAHDAFGYFGDAYGFEVRGLQGLSTATEAGTADVQRLADFIASRGIPALFIESSVSPRHIEAVQAAVRSRGFDVAIGGSLYSDALGEPGTDAESYVGTVRHNIDTIVEALSRDPAPAGA